MKIRKYRAATMREALAEAKRELGADALILSTREVRKGVLGAEVEVTAAIDEGTEAPAQAYGPGGSGPVPAVTGPAAPPPRSALGEADVERIMAPLRAELRSLRSLLRPLADVHGEVAALRDVVAGRIAAPPAAGGGVVAEPRVAPSKARVVVVVGPTGVGKTTTIAKLAARAALVERRRVVLLSLDDYRVGGAEQIRTYADLIGVPLELVDDPARLRGVLDRHRDADRIFVDTAGRSPRDREALWALERGLGGVRDLEVHLAVSAASSAAMIDDIDRRHACLKPARLLFTKLDEALDLTELLAAPARLDLPVTWLTTGQRVPEDLEPATPDRLVALARGARGEEAVA